MFEKEYMVINSIRLWRVGATWKFLTKLSIELFVCLIHTAPCEFYFTWEIVPYNSDKVLSPQVPVDVLLALPMFFRFYLIWRVYLLHTKIFSAKFRAIGSINSIKFDSAFILKTIMEYYPIRLILISNIMLVLCAAWCIRLCEGLYKSTTSMHNTNIL